MSEPIQTEPKKGLSKGCLIGLIVAGVVVVLIAALVVVLALKWDEFAGWALKAGAANEKTLIMKSNITGIDTVQVNRITDAFVAKIDTGGYSQQQIQPFALFIRDQGVDEKVDSAEAVAFVAAMLQCFPDLADLQDYEAVPDTLLLNDTLPSESQQEY